LTLQAIAVPGDAVWTEAPEAVEPAGEADALARPDLRLAVSLDQHQPTDTACTAAPDLTCSAESRKVCCWLAVEPPAPEIGADTDSTLPSRRTVAPR
jgi:hypothetical protein